MIILILIVAAILHACNWQKEMQVLCSLLATLDHLGNEKDYEAKKVDFTWQKR